MMAVFRCPGSNRANIAKDFTDVYLYLIISINNSAIAEEIDCAGHDAPSWRIARAHQPPTRWLIRLVNETSLYDFSTLTGVKAGACQLQICTIFRILVGAERTKINHLTTHGFHQPKPLMVVLLVRLLHFQC